MILKFLAKLLLGKKIFATKLLIGGSGGVISEVVSNQIEQANIQDSTWVNALTQLVIAIATIISLFKRKKQK